ncbi:MAG: N-6 DNA methylase [Clostridia bacterium]|nr:N-6 DNA methylase [Clostridia bacterium]
MAKKTVRVADDQKEFVDTIKKIADRFPTWEVWRDFITMFATSISNVIDKVHAEKREAEYMKIIKKYNRAEQELFQHLAYLVVMALEKNKNRDFLGELYMALNLGSHWHGQFFTPYHICELMAKVTGGNPLEEIKEKGPIKVGDPTCGAGALLVAYANMAEAATLDSGYNWQNHILFAAQDIDMVVGLMCYIQLSLIGCAGYVKIGNTLTEPMSEGEALTNLSKEESCYWYTPMYFSDVWCYRRLFYSLDAIIKPRKKPDKDEDKQEEVEAQVVNATETEEEVSEIELIEGSNGQLSFFNECLAFLLKL